MHETRIIPKDPHEPIPAEAWDELRALWPNGQRLATAWRLAPDLDTLSDLIAGVPVDQSRLDQSELLEARRRSMVVLKTPLDDLPNVKEAA